MFATLSMRVEDPLDRNASKPAKSNRLTVVTSDIETGCLGDTMVATSIAGEALAECALSATLNHDIVFDFKLDLV
ncbi:hypothetical protein PtA15_8A100 [Puccinia triticina]|uniref:Uncharacterized protein n=1 Tax=Puccinia triticina TaxID=208348 RepID=A0ABY7CPT2_9BASI|nr:uncharacterized protein PtA15_8A100 [Puccinia triticina]WAQ87199.1 hypothetical protein PtA15_8A100 [Puccinia triticina]